MGDLDSLISNTWELRTWAVKILVASHEAPGRWPSEEIDLNADEDAAQDLHSFVSHRLKILAVPSSELEWYIRRVTELSGGLFLAADGYLDEIRRESRARRRAWLERAVPAESAADYFAGAIGRAIGTMPQHRQQYDRDQERFLRILALAGWGMTAAEIAGVWNAQPDGVLAAGSSDFRDVHNQLQSAPVARYIAAPEDYAHGRYRLLHPSVREALLRARPIRVEIGGEGNFSTCRQRIPVSAWLLRGAGSCAASPL